MHKLSDLQAKEINGKKVFLRVDVDVPIENGNIKDDARLEAFIPSLEFLLKNQAIVYVSGHLGRPDGEDEKFTLKPVAEWVKKKLELHSELKTVDVNGFKAWELTGNVFVLENLRFYKEEEENNEEFAQKLANTSQIYINDAFASSHREHASIVGITRYIPSYAGLRLEKEVVNLSKVLENPKRPLCVIIGGAKIETKLPLVEKMHGFSDYVLVGGEIAENDKVLLKVQHEKIQGKKSALLVADLTENTKDITAKSAENFLQIAQKSQTVVWNGPMGLTEEKENRVGTAILAKGLAKLAIDKIVGGGDTLLFLKEENILNDFSFVSIGGGAMLEFLAGIKLPGLTALEKS